MYRNKKIKQNVHTPYKKERYKNKLNKSACKKRFKLFTNLSLNVKIGLIVIGQKFHFNKK